MRSACRFSHSAPLAKKIAGTMSTVIFLVFLCSAPPAFAQNGASSKGLDVLLNVSSWVVTVPYGAVKVAYAGLGGIVGGLSYLLTFGNLEPAQTVWQNTMLGTYVLTPAHLTGDEPIRFVGP